MMAIKKKQPPKKKRTASEKGPLSLVPAAPPPPPPPVLTQPQRRFWKVIATKNLIGGAMFLLGCGFCVGFWFSDRAHGIEKVVLGVGLFLIIFGAHFMSSEPTEKALAALGRTAAKVIPLGRRDDPPPPAGEGGV